MATDSYKRFSKELVQRALGKLGLQLISAERTGIEFVNEISRTKTEITVVFDVGANVGKTTKDFLSQFPSAEVHAFEPVTNNFRKLEGIGCPRLHANQLGMGSETGHMKIFLSNNPALHSAIVVEDETKFELVQSSTVDSYCTDQDLSHIGLLKIDTEGNDLNVLIGAERMLSERRIDFVLVETGFYQKPRHVYICDFMDHLARREYFLFGIYEQWFQRGESARIHFANALFARGDIKVSE